MSEHTVAIHQPTFLPWLGYFNKMAHSDTFVILDDVQNPKGHGSYQNRVKFLLESGPTWVTVPIRRDYEGMIEIRDVEIDDHSRWREKAIKGIRHNYGKTPYFEEVFPWFKSWLEYGTDRLLDLNMNAIRDLCQILGLENVNLVMASSLDIDADATDRLVHLVQAVDGTRYRCGDGSDGYLEPERFEEAGIELVFQNFQHPVYPQPRAETFTPGLTVVDALMNCGVERTCDLVHAAPSEPLEIVEVGGA